MASRFESGGDAIAQLQGQAASRKLLPIES